MTRLIYVDDSGTVSYGGLIVYGWVEVAPASWSLALRAWLELRKRLFKEYGIEASKELHCTDYMNGRGAFSQNPPARFIDVNGTVLWKDLGRSVAVECLQTLRDCSHIKIGSYYRWSGKTGSAYAADKYDLYQRLVEDFNDELIRDDSYGWLTMDGNDPNYRRAHRALKLDTRHLIEDPTYHDSQHSQWTQMADLVAYVTAIHLNPHPGNAYGHTWFDDYLTLSGPEDHPKNS